jgi:hypothetical protein
VRDRQQPQDQLLQHLELLDMRLEVGQPFVNAIDDADGGIESHGMPSTTARWPLRMS